MAISDSTISTDIWTEIKNKLVAGLSGVDIRGEYNDKNPNKKQVVIQNVLVPEVFDKFDDTEGSKIATVIIFCYAATPKEANQ